MITTNETRLAIRQTFLDWEHAARANIAYCVMALAGTAPTVEWLVRVLSGASPRLMVAEVIDDLVEDGLLVFEYDRDGEQCVRPARF